MKTMFKNFGERIFVNVIAWVVITVITPWNWIPSHTTVLFLQKKIDLKMD